MKPGTGTGRETGYRRLRAITLASVLRLHEEAARVGETWDRGVRDQGTLDYLVRRLAEMATRRESPERMAGWTLHFIVATHPFWDANHRTGYLVARVVLQAFRQDIRATTEEVERFVRSIDGRGLAVEVVEEWIRSHVVEIR